jgi:hypothetical protein
MGLREEVEELLNKGELPAAFLEQNRLLNSDDELQQQFETEMQRIYSRIMQANVGDDYPQVRFGLQVSDEPNAGVFTDMQPPLIIFSSGLIKLMENESEIAAVLCHELGHQKLRDLIGKHDNGKLEELGADIQSVTMLRNANYPQDALIKAFKLIPEEPLEDILQTVQSVHPDTQNRIRALETTVVAIDKTRGSQSSSSIDDAKNTGKLYDSAQRAYYQSYMDKFFADNRFDQVPNAEKLKILGRAISEELATSDSYYSVRSDEIKQKLSAIDLSRNHSTLQGPIRDFTQVLLDVPQDLDSTRQYNWGSTVNGIYETLQQSYHGKNTKKPVGVFADIQEAINEFINANEEEVVAQKATALLSAINATRGEGKTFLLGGRNEFQGFALPEYDAVKELSSPLSPPWENHISIGISSNNDDIMEALRALNVNEYDRRLASQPDSISLNIEQNKLKSDKGKSQKYIFNDAGQITGVQAQNFDYSEDRELTKNQSSQAVIQEKSALDQTDWERLKVDFNGFVKEHADKLVRLDYEDSEYPFADRFIKELNDVLQSDARSAIEEDVKKYFSYIYAKQNGHDISTSDNLYLTALEQNKQHGSANGFGISVDNPLVQFVLNDEFELFKPIEKLQLLEVTRTNQIINWNVDNSLIYPELPKKTLPEFREWLDTLQTDVNEARPLIKDNKKIKNFLRNEVIKTLEADKSPIDVDDLIFLRSVNNMSEATSDFKQKLSTLIGERFDTIDQNVTDWDLLEQYKILSTGDRLYPSLIEQVPTLRSIYQEEIKQRIDSETNGVRMALLENLFYKQTIHLNNHSDESAYIGLIDNPINYKAKIVDPEFRKWATFSYAKSLSESLGKDDGTPEYSDKLRTTLEKLRDNCSEANTQEIIEQMSKAELGNILQLQPEAAEIVREVNQNISIGRLVSNNMNAALGEGGLKAITSYKTTRDSLIDFLTKPFSENSADRFIKSSEHLLENDSDLEGFLKPGLTKSAKIEQMQMLHANFWDMPFEARIVITDLILFPPAEEKSNDPENVKAVLQNVFDVTLPKAQNNANEGRQIVESYVDACEDIAHQRLLVASMIAAKEPSKDSSVKNLDFGDALNLVLDGLGPAGRKLAQAIESHPQTPRDIKESLANSKTMAINPRREDIIALTKLYEPATPNDAITHVGKVLGAGSYGVTVEVTKQSGEQTAITFLQPNVREKASDEFARLETAVEILSNKNKKFEPLKEMVRQAKEMSVQETDMDLAAKQGEVAAKLYDNVEIKVGGETFQFGAAKFLSHGAEYKEFEIIGGAHFNDIVKDDSQDKAHIKNLATAQIALELSHILSGRPFDHDRHGGQQKIDGNYIGEFDFGAMSVTESSPRQKQLIGHVIAGAIIDSHLKGRNFSQSLEREIDKCAQNEQERDFMAKLKRGVLALGNFQEQIGGMEELKPIIGAIYVSGQMDKDITDAMKERAGKIASGKIFAELEKAGKSSGITIKIPQQQFDKSNDVSPLCAPPKDTLFDRLPVTQEQAVQTGAGVTLATVGGLALLAANDNHQAKDELGNDNKQNPSSQVNAKNAEHAKMISTQKSINKEEQEAIENRNNIIKGAAIATVVIGGALVIDAVTGRHATKALGDMARKIIDGNNRHI